MAGIVERLGSMAGTEAGKAVNLAHQTFQTRMGEHSHFGRAMLETLAEVAREHPNLMGIVAGLLVEQLLVEERRRHEAHIAAVESGVEAPHEGLHLPHISLPHVSLPHMDTPHIVLPHLPTHAIRLNTIRPGHVALEVFGALILLKFASAGARIFRRKNQPEIWFAPASRIHLFSGTLAVYYGAKSLRSPRLSAWRNAAVALFATDAIKPLLKPVKRPVGARPSASSPRVGMGPTLVSPAPTPPEAPPPPAAGPPDGGASNPHDTPAVSDTPPTGANDPALHHAAPAVAVAPQFWTPPASMEREGLRGEIIQWTGFSGANATSSRLID